MARTDAPRCCDKPMTPIVYGIPGPELLEESLDGEVELGGCVIFEDAPMFRCLRCGRTEGRLGEIMDEHFEGDDW